MTERRRKTRKTELKHGDLFHVYIASDAPQEVCDFLTELKQSGDFSFEILQIIANHVRQTKAGKGTLALQPTAPSNEAVDQQMQAAAAETTGDDGQHESQISVDTQVESGLQNQPPNNAETTETQGSNSAEEAFDPVAMLRRQRRAWVAGK